MSSDSRAADGERLRLRLRLMERERPREGPLRTFMTLGCLWAMLATCKWPLRVTQLLLWSPRRDKPGRKAQHRVGAREFATCRARRAGGRSSVRELCAPEPCLETSSTGFQGPEQKL